MQGQISVDSFMDGLQRGINLTSKIVLATAERLKANRQLQAHKAVNGAIAERFVDTSYLPAPRD